MKPELHFEAIDNKTLKYPLIGLAKKISLDLLNIFFIIS